MIDAQQQSSAPGRAAAFFDLDKTIIATNSAMAFSRPFLAQGVLSRGDMLRTAYAQLLFHWGGADADQTERLRQRLSELVTGWDVAQVSAIVDSTLHEHIDPVVYVEAVELIADHHRAGHDVVIVSASGSEVVRPIAAALGADHVIASELEIVDGRYTGDIDFYAYGENKAIAIRRLAEQNGYDLERSFAYSDSITDEPMLAAVGNSFVVNPDRNLRRLAEERGWQALSFSRPIRLRDALRPALPAAVVLLGVVAGLAAWQIWRYRRRQPR